MPVVIYLIFQAVFYVTASPELLTGVYATTPTARFSMLVSCGSLPCSLARSL